MIEHNLHDKMGTGLHVRKKALCQDDNPDPEVPSNKDEDDNAKKVQRRQSFLRRLFRSEVGCAIEAIMAFLFFGFVLGYLMLHHQHRKVILPIILDPLGHGAALKGRVGFRHHFYIGHPRTVTVVMPSVVNQDGRRKRLESIQETWGTSARAIFVVHTVNEFPAASHAVISENRSPEDPYSYPQLLLVPDGIDPEDGVARLIHTIKTVFEKVNPDFAFFVNDHTFVIPEHLCSYVEHKNPSEDMYDGHAMRDGKKMVFNSGAAGYILSRETMRKLVGKWSHDECTGATANDWLQGNPGLLTAECLSDELGIKGVDTRQSEKYHRFHAYPLTRMVAGDVDEWFENKHREMGSIEGFTQSYSKPLSGLNCCARDTISFHYVEFMESKALFATREALLENPHMTDHELRSLMIAEWPSKQREVGRYSRELPAERDRKEWEPLLKVVRKMSSRSTQREC
mmetsp:Transcript_4165/g.10071  ORF Transcript_4165/g.10071 Transcript_4165/m.10071 type:complete len:455 (-) Transcript_4165:28-1392(-)